MDGEPSPRVSRGEVFVIPPHLHGQASRVYLYDITFHLVATADPVPDARLSPIRVKERHARAASIWERTALTARGRMKWSALRG